MTKVSRDDDTKPLVSVVVPIYNVEEYLPRCLDSIINQTYQNLQIIIVNDGSTDNSLDIIKCYAARDKRIEIVNKKNGGLSDARNCGIEKCHGKFTTLIDSDDYADAEMVEVLVNSALRHHADLVISGYTIEYPTKSVDSPAAKNGRVATAEEALYSLLYSRGVDVSAWGKLYATSLLKRYQYPVGRMHEDSATTYKYIMAANTIYIDAHCMYHYLMKRAESITNSSFSKKELDLIKSVREMTIDVSKSYPRLQTACNRKLMWAYQSVFRRYSLANKQTRQKYRQTSHEVYDYIRRNRREITADHNAPRRDRIACHLAISYNLLIWSNRIYEKIRNQ